MAQPFYRRPRTYLYVAAVWILAALAGSLTGRFLRLDLPDVNKLEDYQPPVMSRVLSRDGSLIANFAEEKRLMLDHGEIPPAFRDALIATEDANFYRHTGVDVRGVLRAVWADIRSRSLEEGASTLTMQLAGNLFLDRSQKTARRKLQEMILSFEIERQYSKDEILRFYVNQVHFGHGLYGLEAAARYYYGKPAAELGLNEHCSLVGILPRPATYTPLRNPDLTRKRRNHVLNRMVKEGYLDAETAAATRELPIETSRERGPEDPAPYFTEEVRRWLQESYGSSGVYREGLEVRTTVDTALQAKANAAMDLGLRELDKRQGWRPEALGQLPDGVMPEDWRSDSWEELEAGMVVDGLVVATDKETATLRVAEYTGRLDAKAIEWTGVKRPGELLRVGQIARVRVEALDDEDGSATLLLEQKPEAEAALVALDPTSGEVLAMVGGFDFERSEFNRAIQAKRQTGSAFKPFVFTAALAEGWTLADTIVDEPTVFLDASLPAPYQPENFSRKYYETITLRTAMEKSANIATVKLLDAIGYDAVIQTARRLGIDSNLRPYPSLALGAFEITLLELTAAYGVFANQGVYAQPHWIQEVYNRDGFVVHRHDPVIRDAVEPQVAYLMNRVLTGVISDGTGKSAASLGHPLAGKTGTTDDSTDAWFIGYSPRLAVGVWVGFDERKPLGKNETGASAALPIWREFMRLALENVEPTEFPVPQDVSIVSIDRATGLKANRNALCNDVISEAFIRGTEPTQFCSVERRRQLMLPYSLQGYSLGADGALQIPHNELSALLERDMSLFLDPGGSAIHAVVEGATVSFPIRLLADSETPSPGRYADSFDATTWKGTDGRKAKIVWMN